MKSAYLRKKQKGFSMLEMAIVLLIIAVLSAVIIPHILDLIYQARMKQARSQAQDLKKIVMQYQLDPLMNRPLAERGTFTADLEATPRAITLRDLVSHGYLDAVPLNPWKKSWELKVHDFGTISAEVLVYSFDDRGRSVEIRVGPQ